jgi:thiol-disulfide isomerase/thioredoxin
VHLSFPRRFKLFILIAIGLSAAFFQSCRPQTETPKPPEVVRQPPTTYPMPPVKAANPDMGWRVANIQHVKLTDLKDKVVILDFYATWCEPCKAAIPHLIELNKRYSASGLQIVGLNVGGTDDYEQVPAFARTFKIPYQLGIPDPELEQLYLGDDLSIPQTFVLDRKGRVVKHYVGYDESMAPLLESQVIATLSGS